MSWTPKHSLRNSMKNSNWVAWGNKKTMREIYEWKNLSKPKGWALSVINSVILVLNTEVNL